MLKRLLLLVLSGAALFVHAQKVNIGSTPAWINEFRPDLNANPREEIAGGYYYLLVDKQENVGREERYVHYAYKILTNEGIQQMSDVFLNFDPAYEKLTVHRLSIHRNGTVIDQLAPSSITTIQREESIDRHLYDGSLTAVVNFKDVRVGDVIEYACTFKGYNPIFQGHFTKRLDLNYYLPCHRVVTKILIPSQKDVQFKFVNGAINPVKSNRDGQIEYSWDLDQVDAVIPDDNYPSWYDPYQYVQISEFRNWSGVVNWARQHFQLTDIEQGKLNQRISEFEKLNAKSLEDITSSIIRFVQDDVRYLGFESGLNAYKPHPPSKVYDQRFGDCKDKSLLLVSMLDHYNIKAHPMLVNTQIRHKLSEVLPASDVFNHCVVAIEMENEIFYVDPTINNQGGSLKSNYFPSYGYGLIIKEGQNELTQLPEAGIATTTESQSFVLGEVDGEAELTIETTYEGSDADAQRSHFASNSLEVIQKNYVTYNSNMYPDIVATEKVQYSDDRQNNVFIVTEKYRIPSFWTADAEVPEQINADFYPLTLESFVNVGKSSHRTAPYYLSYPVSYKHLINVSLPEDWTIESAEKNIVGDGYRFDHKVSYANRQLSIARHYQTFKEHVMPEAFPKFIKDHQNMMNTLGYMLSYNKNLAGGFKLSWLSVLFGLLVLGAASAGVYHLYFNYDPEPRTKIEYAQPIGGWLILVAIGLFLTPFRILYDVISTDEYFNSATWTILVSQNQWGTIIVMVAELIYNISYFVFAILIVLLFLKRRTSLPRLISFYYGVAFLVTSLDTMAGLALSGEPVDYPSIKEILRTLLVAVIWIPYFNLSERVKETFVEQIKREPDPDPEKTMTYTLKG